MPFASSKGRVSSGAPYVPWPSSSRAARRVVARAAWAVAGPTLTRATPSRPSCDALSAPGITTWPSKSCASSARPGGRSDGHRMPRPVWLVSYGNVSLPPARLPRCGANPALSPAEGIACRSRSAPSMCPGREQRRRAARPRGREASDRSRAAADAGARAASTVQARRARLPSSCRTTPPLPGVPAPWPPRRPAAGCPPSPGE